MLLSDIGLVQLAKILNFEYYNTFVLVFIRQYLILYACAAEKSNFFGTKQGHIHCSCNEHNRTEPSGGMVTGLLL